MKLSQVGLNTLLEMPPKDKISFILNGIADAGNSCEYALLNLMKKNGLKADECIMVGDRDIDILAGKNAGMVGILMDTEGYYPQLSVEYRITELKEIKNCL